MKFVKKYLNTKLTAAEAAKIINQSIQEVDSVSYSGVKATGVISVKIVDIQKHPNADKLHIISVDDGESITDIVTGAPNIEIGIIIALAKPGAKICAVDHKDPNFDLSNVEMMEIKTVNLRGIDSPGMVCGPDELGISDKVTNGLYIFPDGTPLGKPVNELIPSLEIIETDDKGTAHRPDLLSYKGMELELNAVQGIKLDRNLEKTNANVINKTLAVSHQNSDLATCFCVAQISGLKKISTPKTISDFLEDNGVKLINYATDVTNYFMLLEGVPTHAFDAKAVGDSKIGIRYASENESISVLNGQSYKLNTDDIVIADSKGALDIAGIIGGTTSSTTVDTDTIILTAAAWNPVNVRNTSRRLSLRTEASARFERGLSAQIVINTFNRIVEEFKSNKVKIEYFNIIYLENESKKEISLTEKSVKDLLGVDIDITQINHYLNLLAYSADGNKFTAPFWRKDINIAPDVIEDIARLHGYDKIPSLIPNLTYNNAVDSDIFAFCEKLRQMCHHFAYEVKTSIFSSKHDEKSFEVANPIGDKKYIKETNLDAIQSAAQNFIYRGSLLFTVFEICNVYQISEKGINENRVLSFASSLDIDDFKSELATCLHQFKIDYGKVRFASIETENLIKYKNNIIGKFTINKIRNTNVICTELNVKSLFDIVPVKIEYKTYSTYPTVKRDLAFVIDKKILLGDISDFIELQSELIVSIELFDKFSDAKFGDNKQSLAFHLTFQAKNSTLKDDEVNQIMRQIEKDLVNKYSVIIREE